MLPSVTTISNNNNNRINDHNNNKKKNNKMKKKLEVRKDLMSILLRFYLCLLSTITHLLTPLPLTFQ